MISPYILALSPLWQFIDFWAERYQTIGVGLLAVVFAGLQVWVSIQQTRIAKQQTSLMEEQMRLAMRQDKVELALAQATIKEFMQAANQVRYRRLGSGYAISRAELLRGLPVVNVDAIKDAAIYAYPEKAGLILDLAWAADAVQKLYADYDVEPWRDTEDAMANAIGPNDWSLREIEMTAQTKRVATELEAAFDAVGGLT